MPYQARRISDSIDSITEPHKIGTGRENRTPLSTTRKAGVSPRAYLHVIGVSNWIRTSIQQFYRLWRRHSVTLTNLAPFRGIEPRPLQDLRLTAGCLHLASTNGISLASFHTILRLKTFNMTRKQCDQILFGILITRFLYKNFKTKL